MSNIVPINHVPGSINEVPDVSSEFTDPDAVAGGAGCETAGVVAVDVRILVLSETVNFVGDILVDAGCGVDAVHELAWEGLAVALASGEVVVVVVETFVETGVCGRDSRHAIQGRIQGCSCCEMSGPVGARLYAFEQVGRYIAGVGGLQRVVSFGLSLLKEPKSRVGKTLPQLTTEHHFGC